MTESNDFLLSQHQADFISTKLPVGYSFLLSSLAQPREQRIKPKKVSRYDATFQTTKHEEESKRPIRLTPKEPPNENVKKGQLLISKLRQHPKFNEFYQPLSNQCDLDSIERTFVDTGSLQQLWNDLRKVFAAAYQIYPKDSQSYLNTVQVQNHFNEIFKFMQPAPKKKPIQNEQPMTFQEKRQLGQNIRELQVEHLKGVWEIVSQIVKADGDEQLEFDIDKLPEKVARQLQKYVQSKMQQKDVIIRQQSQKKVRVENQNIDSSFPSESSD
ncbi:hypothetical protein pb186bvf_013945 [Paramecium bursaria]